MSIKERFLENKLLLVTTVLFLCSLFFNKTIFIICTIIWVGSVFFSYKNLFFRTSEIVHNSHKLKLEVIYTLTIVLVLFGLITAFLGYILS